MNLLHIKIFYRNLKANPFSTAIKVIGLSIGFVSIFLIYAYVRHETSYDKKFKQSENIFRIIRNWQDSKDFNAYTPVPLLNAMKEEFPEIITGTRLAVSTDNFVIYKNRIFHEDLILRVDSTFFKTFNMSLIEGDQVKALTGSCKVVISKRAARKYFGNEDPVGKTLIFEGANFDDGNKLFTVTGVFENFPNNCHLQGDFLLSIRSFRMIRTTESRNHVLMTYIQLRNSTDRFKINKKLPAFMKNLYGADYFNYARSTYKLQPIEDIHLNTGVDYEGYETDKGSTSNIIIFPVLGFLILLIASINYVNLSIVEGRNKSKVFGINIILGSGKNYFFSKYIIESIIFCFSALLISTIIIENLLPYFERFINRTLELGQIINQIGILLMLLIVTFLGIINGIFPAIVYASKKNTLQYLKGTNINNNIRFDFNITSQIVQFTICIMLFAGSIIVFKQMEYVDRKVSESLDKDNVLIIKNPICLGNKRQFFKEELKKIPGVKEVSLCGEVPGIDAFSHWGHPIDPANADAHIAVFNVDDEYLNTLKIELIMGRFFDPQYKDDFNKIVLNETAIKTLGWGNPIGKRYRLDKIYNVIGVVKDIHFVSLHYPIIPQGYLLIQPNNADKILIKIEKKNINRCMADIQSLWSSIVPDRTMFGNFINKEFDFWYKTEQKTGIISLILSAIAIFLSCLGLFGMVLHTIQYRTKEIGIRKVNGARIWEIMTLLNKNFLSWVVIAFVIACPIVWYVMNRWLQNFAYKTEISGWIFVISGVVVLTISLLTVSWQSYRAANRNPVESLRYE
jgi:putative ABC transport system permease protein